MRLSIQDKSCAQQTGLFPLQPIWAPRIPPKAVTMQLTWGARPPRAQWAVPSRRTACTQSIHCLVCGCMPGFGARARRTAAEAAALPI